MKTKALFSIMLFLCLGAGAQNKVLITKDVGTGMPGHTWVSQVRHWPGTDFAVTLTGTDTTAGFCIINYNPFSSGIANPLFPLRYVKLPVKISSLYDFCVIDNHVFFCADTFIYGVYNKYFVGYFDLNELLYDTLVNYTMLPIDTAASLYKIAGFHDSYGYKVYVAGTVEVGGDHHFALFEVDNPLTATTYNCAYFSVSSPLYAERIDDIVFLGDAVVFVGRNNINTQSNYCAVSIRKASKTLGINDPDFARVYLYPDPQTPDCEYNSAMRAVALSEEQFVVVYSHGEDKFTKRIRVFDYGLNNINSQEYRCDDKYAVYDMIYHPRSRRLTILEPYVNTSRFVFAAPLITSTYSALTMIENSRTYISLDDVNTNSFVAAGTNAWLMNSFQNVPLPYNSCVQGSLQDIYPISNMTRSFWLFCIPFSGNINPILYKQVPQTNVIGYHCKNY